MKPLIVFFTLAYLISWLVWLPLYGPAMGLHGLPVMPWHHALGGLGPLIAAFVTQAVYGGKQGLRSLLKACIQPRSGWVLLVALIGPFALEIIALWADSLISGRSLSLEGFFHSREFPELHPLLFLVYNLVFFGWGEETGWRGFALPRLQQRYKTLISALIISALWAVWHWPLFFYRPGYVSMDAAGVAGWCLSLLTGSILLSWLYNSSRGSVLICAVFHATVDIAFTAKGLSPEATGYMGALITIWGIATIFFLKPRYVSPAP